MQYPCKECSSQTDLSCRVCRRSCCAKCLLRTTWKITDQSTNNNTEEMEQDQSHAECYEYTCCEPCWPRSRIYYKYANASRSTPQLDEIACNFNRKPAWPQHWLNVLEEEKFEQEFAEYWREG